MHCAERDGKKLGNYLNRMQSHYLGIITMCVLCESESFPTSWLAYNQGELFPVNIFGCFHTVSKYVPLSSFDYLLEVCEEE